MYFIIDMSPVLFRHVRRHIPIKRCILEMSEMHSCLFYWRYLCYNYIFQNYSQYYIQDVCNSQKLTYILNILIETG